MGLGRSKDNSNQPNNNKSNDIFNTDKKLSGGKKQIQTKQEEDDEVQLLVYYGQIGAYQDVTCKTTDTVKDILNQINNFNKDLLLCGPVKHRLLDRNKTLKEQGIGPGHHNTIGLSGDKGFDGMWYIDREQAVRDLLKRIENNMPSKIK